MQDARALKNSANLASWRQWEGEACERSGFTALLWSLFGLMISFVFTIGLFAPALGDDPIRTSLIGLGLYLAVSFALMAFAVMRINAWKRAHPWTPPS